MKKRLTSHHGREAWAVRPSSDCGVAAKSPFIFGNHSQRYPPGLSLSGRLSLAFKQYRNLIVAVSETSP